MWSRVVEFMLGCWLAVSPFVFRHAAGDTALWVNDFGCAAAVMLMSLVSCWHPLRYAHVLLVGVGGWMIVFGYLHFGGEVPPAVQNNVLVGLLLVMFAVIPNHASRPPSGWRKSPGNASGSAPMRKSADQSRRELATQERART